GVVGGRCVQPLILPDAAVRGCIAVLPWQRCPATIAAPPSGGATPGNGPTPFPSSSGVKPAIMAYRSLAEFIDDLIRAGELVRIAADVDPCLEIAEVTRRLQMQDGPAVMFASVRGSDFPVLANLFGTERRLAMALGASSLAEAAARLESAWKEPARNWLDQLRQFAGLAGESAATGRSDQHPRLIKQGACQQVVRLAGDVDLHALPAVQLWPEESPARINAAAVFTAAKPSAAATESAVATAEAAGAAKVPQAANGTAHVAFARHDCTVVGRNRLAVSCRADDPLAE